MHIGPHVKYPLFLSDFNEKLNFLYSFLFEKYSNLMNMRSVGAELFNADRRTYGQTDMTIPVVSFRNFVNAP